MDRIDINKPETPQEKLEYIMAIREQEMAHFMASSDGGVGITADTLDDVQVSGFEPKEDSISIVITDSSDGDHSLEQIAKRSGKRVKGIAPLVVGRYTWRLGFAVETYDGGLMLLAVMNEEDSEVVIDTLKEKGHVYLKYRSDGVMEERMESKPQIEHMGRLIGGEIKLEYLVDNIITGHLEHIPGDTH